MGHLLSVIFQAVRRNLFLLTFIVLVLIAGKYIRSEWVQVQGVVGDLPALRAADAQVSKHQAALGHGLAQQVGRMSQASVEQLDSQIRILDNEMRALQDNGNAGSDLAGALTGPDSIVESLRQKALRGVEIELKRQARAHLIALRTHLIVLSDRKAAIATLAQLRLAHVENYAALQTKEQQLAELEAAAGVMAKIPFTLSHRQAQKLRRDIQFLADANSRAHADYLAQQAILARLSLPATLSQFRVNQQQLAQAVSPLRTRLVEAERLAAQNYLWKTYQAVRSVLPVAIAVLIGWWLLPVLVRTLFYFVLAPLATRRPPIVICPKASSATVAFPAKSATFSAVSQTMKLPAGYEILIRPDYCQSQPAGVRLTTTLLFDWSRSITSIAAHLWMLKRLRTTQPADIVVSSTANPLDEVALLDIAAGEAIVLQPRGLVGMMYQTGQRPAIRSHWRLGTLHAWLTLQLRYLVFEGPVTLVVKGCRGVRLESASNGRTISQDATLGFSVNALYATVRADPFIPYLRGKQALFHDKFTGNDAYYLYEEVPRNARPDGTRQNPVEALLDAGMKAFGV